MTSAFPYKTVVDTPAESKDLTVKATVKAELGITVTTYDDQIDTNIHQASALIVGYCNREFASEIVTESFRPTCYGPLETLWLTRTPVTDIEEVIEDGTTLDAALYELNAVSGELWRLDSAGYRCSWTSGVLTTVEYTGGYVSLTTLPHDVERACIEQVKATFKSRLRDPTIKSETMPDVHQVSYALAGGDFIGASGLLKSVEGALAPYKRWVIG
jgi:hypothetical protein